MKLIAGSWLIASVCMLRMKHISSTILAVYGNSSLTHMPHLPCWANLNFDGAIGKPLLAGGHRRQPLSHADRFGQVLVVPLVHHRLVVVQIHLRRPADHVQIDHLLGLRREMRQIRGNVFSRFRAARIAAGQAIAHQRCERRSAEQVASLGEEVAACEVLTELVEGVHDFLVVRSLRERKELLIVVKCNWLKCRLFEVHCRFMNAIRRRGERITGLGLRVATKSARFSSSLCKMNILADSQLGTCWVFCNISAIVIELVGTADEVIELIVFPKSSLAT